VEEGEEDEYHPGGIIEEYRPFPRWIWIAIVLAMVWAWIIGPFGLFTPK